MLNRRAKRGGFRAMDSGMAPTGVGQRIDTLDALRGIAICGILLMNIPLMGAVGFTSGLTYPAGWNADWIAWIIQSLFFEGTMRGLFTLLFGAGFLLMLRRAEGDDPQVTPFDVWGRRSLALMFFGVIQAFVFMWPGEILWNYGITGLGLLAFRLARPRTLMIWAAAALFGLSAIQGLQSMQRAETMRASIAAQAAKDAGRKLTPAQQQAIEAVQAARAEIHPTQDAIDKKRAQRTQLPGLLSWCWEIWSQFNLSTEGWLGMLESFAFMLIGMALFRAGIVTGDARTATYWRLAIIGYAAGFALRIVGLLYQARAGFDLDVTKIIPLMSAYRGFIYEPARLAITLGHVGLIVGLYKAGLFGRAWPVRAMGRTALTVYSLQSILTSILFYAFGLVGRLGFFELMLTAAAIWVTTGLFAMWWLSIAEMGPAEYALRWLSYGARRVGKAPFRATAPLPAATA